MKVLAILLALVNSLMAGLVLLSCITVTNLNWDGLGWLAVRVLTGVIVILTGILTFRDGIQAISPGKVLVTGLLLVFLGTGSAMWGVHLTILSGDVKNVMILFGGSLVLQGIAFSLDCRKQAGWLYNRGMRRLFAMVWTLVLCLTACLAPSRGATLPTSENVSVTRSATLPPATPSNASRTTDTSTPQPSETPAPTDTPLSPPTNNVLIGEVNAEKLACRYGPGWPYLYFTGLLKGNRLEIIGRLDDANWIYVQAIGGNKPCWIKAEFMDVQGELMSVEPVYPDKAKLPVSPYYPPTTVLKVSREGSIIKVSWLDIPLRAGDEEDERMNHYIIEVWRCEGGLIHFEPLATNYLEVSFIDEPGCAEPSRGRVFVQEKHGFAGPADIPWQPFEE